jgi:hypothetical protein
VGTKIIPIKYMVKGVLVVKEAPIFKWPNPKIKDWKKRLISPFFFSLWPFVEPDGFKVGLKHAPWEIFY